MESNPIVKGLIAAFVTSQIRIMSLFVFINVFARISACVWLCGGVCMCALQRLSVIPVRNRLTAFRILPLTV